MYDLQTFIKLKFQFFFTVSYEEPPVSKVFIIVLHLLIFSFKTCFNLGVWNARSPLALMRNAGRVKVGVKSFTGVAIKV